MFTPTENSIRKQPRRTSVTPVGQLSIKSGYSRRSLSNSNESTSLTSTDKLRRMSQLFSIDRNKTKEVIMAALEDPARIEFKRLKIENEHLTSEWKQLRKFLEQLQTDYETNRVLDPLRRYKNLQVMIKRTVMHIRFTEPGSSMKNTNLSMNNNDTNAMQGDVLQSETKVKEMEKRVEQMCETYTIEELTIQNRRLREQNERLENRIQLIVQIINELDFTYRSSKNESFLKRYNALKDAVKRIISDENLFENP